jgi:hypothetical protein
VPLAIRQRFLYPMAGGRAGYARSFQPHPEPYSPPLLRCSEIKLVCSIPPHRVTSAGTKARVLAESCWKSRPGAPVIVTRCPGGNRTMHDREAVLSRA